MKHSTFRMALFVGVALGLFALAMISVLGRFDPSIAGEWNVDTGKVKIDGVLILNHDGTFESTTTGPANEIDEAPEGTLGHTVISTVTGTWELKEDKLHLLFNDSTLTMDGTEIKVETQERGLEKQRMLAAMNAASPFTIEWLSADEFEATSGGTTRSYTRAGSEQ